VNDQFMLVSLVTVTPQLSDYEVNCKLAYHIIETLPQ